MLGIGNLTKLVALIAALANMGDKIGHETGMARWGELFGLVGAVQSINGLDFKQVMPEIKDLDQSERDQLLALFKTSFDIQDDKLEAVIEEGLGIAEDLVSIYTRSATLVASYKKA